MEGEAFLLGEVEIETTDSAGATDDGGPAVVGVGVVVVGGDGEDAHFVTEDAVDDTGDASGDAVVGGAFFADDVVGFVGDKIGDAGASVLGEEAGNLLAAGVGERPEGEFGVAVFADLVGVDGFGVEI